MCRLLALISLWLAPTVASAEQPVFGMMPRWANGWGVQSLYELNVSDDVRYHALHIEGVYTWARWIRVTYKVPLVLESQISGTQKSERGVGVPLIALPLKKYFNRDGLSGSWSLTPRISLPVATTMVGQNDEYGGVGVSYAHETYVDAVDLGSAIHVAVDGAIEAHGVTSYGRKVHFSDTFGIGRLRLDGKWRTTGAAEIRLGGVVYARISDRVHVQATLMRSVWTEQTAPSLSVRGGVGFVF